MSLKHAILGFLSFKPMSGYDLKKAFDRSVRHFWPANQSQIYRTLAELDEGGLVEKEVIERGERLDMKVYQLSEAGGTELHRWLSTPLPPQDFREPFLIQIYFGGRLSDSEMSNLLEREIRATEERLAVYKSIHQENVARMKDHEDPRSFFLSLLTLEYGVLSNQALLRWLRSAVERVQSGNYTPADLWPSKRPTHRRKQ